MLTQSRLREVLDYCPETGEFRWKIRPSPKVNIGDVAGSPDKDGYTIIRIEGQRYAASRLAFLWMLGRWPYADCDHRDGIPSNNRWLNLRDATTTQNMQNKRVQSNNKLGLKGVHLHSAGKYRARIRASSRDLCLGLYDCPAAAHLSYIVAANTHFGAFARSS